MPFKNKEDKKQHNKQYYLDNVEKIKQYQQTENGKKTNKIAKWKHKGIITDDYDFLYEWYMSINNCMNCNIELISGTGTTNHKHLDHDHLTNEPCIVVCGYCNIHILK